MIKKEIKLYKFKELKPEIQEKVIDNFKEEEDFYFLEEELKGELKILLDNYNIKYDDNLVLMYSLSYCQGDGVSFIGNFTYKNKNVKISLGNRSNMYCHSNTTDIYIYDDEENEDLALYEEFNDIYHKICAEIEQIGYNIIEDTLKDNNIIGDIEAIGYYFTEKGDVWE